MVSKENTPFFSIILCTRDRPELFQVALNSVLQQSCSDREIIVVIDGSEESNLAKYREIERHNSGIVFHRLDHKASGHGQSYAMNVGADLASSQYLCFLDDDDLWTDSRYLDNVLASIGAAGKPVDVHYSNQKACFFDGSEQAESVWLEDLIPNVNTAHRNDVHSYWVDAKFLLTSRGFAHLNCSVFRHEFYDSIGGMDETIRYENDRDVYLRSIDAATAILFNTQYMSLHNIPDIDKKSNMSTMSSRIDRKLYQLRVYDKGIALGKKASVVAFCYKAKAYELKNIVAIQVEKKRHKSAAFYAREALAGGFNLRWLVYTLYLMTRALLVSDNATSNTAQ